MLWIQRVTSVILHVVDILVNIQEGNGVEYIAYALHHSVKETC